MTKKAKRSKGVFIALEGPDKSGKSTQAGLLVRALIDHGRSVVHTREPGGTIFAEAIRKLLLDPEHRVVPLAELFLYEAARAQHTEELIRPALKRGAVVVSERFTLATLAYQGHARGLQLSMVRQLNKIATGGLAPDLTIVLDIPDSQFEARDPDRKYDRLELESAAFRHKVRAAYRRLSRSEPRVVLVDATNDRSVIHTEIVAHVDPFLKRTLNPVPFRT
ncbi:MAG: dTMP kinase [Elusimicrobiota bacterium]